jgi:hypothetical protein
MRAIGNRLPFVSETAGSRDLSGHHFLAAKKPAVAASKIARRSLPSVRRKPITSR